MNRRQYVQGVPARLLLLVLLGLAMLVVDGPASGQEGEPSLILEIDRQVGLGLGTRIQGTFEISAHGPPELSRVEFHIDGQLLAQDTSPPFEIQLRTGNYPAGKHTLSAVGILDNGQTLESELLLRNFVSGSWVFVVLIVVIVIALALRVLPAIVSSRRSNEYTPVQEYGYLGGAICRSCRKPFRLHLWSPRLLVGRLQRCPHCGRWQLARRVSLESLAEAERNIKGVKGETDGGERELDDDRLSQRLEDSRFEDS